MSTCHLSSWEADREHFCRVFYGFLLTQKGVWRDLEKPCFERWTSATLHWPLSFHRDVSPALSASSLSIKIPRTIKLHLRWAAFGDVPTAYGCLSVSKVSVPVDQPQCMIETCECWMTAENYTFISHRKEKLLSVSLLTEINLWEIDILMAGASFVLKNN